MVDFTVNALVIWKKNGNHSSFWIKNQNKYQFDMGMFIAVSKNSSKIFNYLRSIILSIQWTVKNLKTLEKALCDS